MDSEPLAGTQPTTAWVPGETVVDGYGLAIPLATPPGDYPLILAMYDAQTGERLPVTGPGAQGDHLLVGHIEIVPPREAPPVAILGIRFRAQDVQRGVFRFLGYNRYKQGFAHAPDMPLEPGDILHLTTFWEATAVPDGDYRFAFLMDGVPLGQYPLAGPGYPTSQWLPDMPWRGEHAIPLPPDLATGRTHAIQLQLLDPNGQPVGEPIDLKPGLVY